MVFISMSEQSAACWTSATLAIEVIPCFSRTRALSMTKYQVIGGYRPEIAEKSMKR